MAENPLRIALSMQQPAMHAHLRIRWLLRVKNTQFSLIHYYLLLQKLF